MTTHATIDIETLDITPDAVVLTIGGVKFDPFTKEAPYSDLYIRMDADQQMEAGRTVSEDTLKWWNTQPQEIQDQLILSLPLVVRWLQLLIFHLLIPSL